MPCRRRVCAGAYRVPAVVDGVLVGQNSVAPAEPAYAMARKKPDRLAPPPAAAEPVFAHKDDARARRRALRLHGSIARDLGVLIVSGRYKPGEVLNGEVSASDRL